MDDAALARLEHENMIEANMVAAGQVPGSHVGREGGVAVFLTGLPMRSFNQVVVADESATADRIRAAVDVARGRGDRFAVTLRRGLDDRYRQVVDSLGLVPLSADPWMPGMALHPLPAVAATPPPSGHEIRRVTDAAAIAEHRRTAAAGFGMPVEWLEAIITADLARCPGVTIYVGYTEGVALTTGLGIRTGMTMGIYTITTLEGARGRGYGAAMTMRLVEDGVMAGCDVAILQASDMGKPVYERLGFRTVVQYMGYVDPASLPAATTESPAPSAGAPGDS
jgi:GNAT superfamily N-acetyltransferase